MSALSVFCLHSVNASHAEMSILTNPRTTVRAWVTPFLPPGHPGASPVCSQPHKLGITIIFYDCLIYLLTNPSGCHSFVNLRTCLCDSTRFVLTEELPDCSRFLFTSGCFYLALVGQVTLLGLESWADGHCPPRG